MFSCPLLDYILILSFLPMCLAVCVEEGHFDRPEYDYEDTDQHTNHALVSDLAT